MFEKLQPLDEFDYKKMAIASCLNAAMVSKMTTRSMLAEQLGWSKSYMTRFLSGKANLTLRTIHEFTSALGYDVDLAIHDAGTAGPLQPWQAVDADAYFTPVFNPNEVSPTFQVQIRMPSEVANDLITGNYADAYLAIQSFPPSKHLETSRIAFDESQINQPFDICSFSIDADKKMESVV
ncbi:helix-turn-helix transcriptional regulator [Variovorax soli]|uniref:DNA-binding phage protein n=1 Tax=Variovorax soli TaxID=376815 RepID=A0ABU1NK71_9BURK|nr:helix-turn-helix transcriptional regulator [Variovorax soli]MDR6538870.1 DNA-binding phage protein [Variovorax soli]